MPFLPALNINMNEVPHTIKTDVKPTIINLPKEEGIFNNAINTINTEIPPITNARKRTSLVYFPAGKL